MFGEGGGGVNLVIRRQHVHTCRRPQAHKGCLVYFLLSSTPSRCHHAVIFFLLLLFFVLCFSFIDPEHMYFNTF